MLSIALAVITWRVEQRRWARWLAYSVLGAVIFQGVLGGLRVVMVNLDLAIVHACFAQAFFCMTGLVCVVTSRWWIDSTGKMSVSQAGTSPRDTGFQPVRLARIATVACVIIYLQLIAGAVMRHEGAGLAVPDFPL